MAFEKLSQNSKKLLDEILQSDNPVEMLCRKLDGVSYKEDEELRGIIRELCTKGYINVGWASNLPYHVTIDNSARTYNEQLEEYEREKLNKQIVYVTDKSIKIGDGNTISDSVIAGQISDSRINDTAGVKKGFAENHPILVGIGVGVASGVLLMFPFWETLVNWIEGIF